MTHRALIAILLAVSIAFGLGANPALAHELEHVRPASSTQLSKEIAAFAQAMAVGMDKMMKDMHRPSMTGDPDVDFLAMMIPHHEGAVEMARLVLIYGRDPLARQLAEEIIASQQVEIAAMQSRLSTLKKGINLDPDSFPAIGGIRGIHIR